MILAVDVGGAFCGVRSRTEPVRSSAAGNVYCGSGQVTAASGGIQP